MSRFLSSFETYFQKSTDAPKEFGHTAGLSCLSTVTLGRRWIQRGKGLHPNIFWILVAGSSKDRKSTSVDLAEGVIKVVEPERVGPNDFTPEGLADWMENPPRKGASSSGKARRKITIFDSEFGGFLVRCSKSFGMGLPSMLCQLYDCQDFNPARRGRCTSIVDPRVSLLAACAYGMIEHYSQPEFWVDGFWARFVFVTPQAPKQVYLLQPVTASQDFDVACAALMDLRRELKNSRGAMQIVPAAEHLYNAYATSFDESKLTQRERYLRVVWKLATLYQIDDNPQHPIGPVAVDRAISYVSAAWQAFLKVYSETGGNEFARILSRVEERVKAAGSEGVPKRVILRAFHLKSGMLTAVLDVLMKFGAVQVQQRSSASGGHPQDVLVWRS